MEMKQLGEIATSAINQIMGVDYITELNDSNIVDVGKDITDSNRVDAVMRTLNSMIGKLEIQTGVYKKKLKSLFVDSWEWGGFLERVYCDLESVADSLMWSLTDGRDYSKEEHTYHKPKVSAKIFEESKAIMTTISMGTEQFKEAFRSMDELNKYATMVRTNMRNTMNVALDSLAHALLSSAVAVSDKAIGNSVHLLRECISNGILTEGATVNDFMKNKDALAYACKRIADVREYMTGINKTYNNGNLATFCEDSDIVLLHDFKSTVDYFVRPTNYQDLVNVDGETIIAWQGTSVDETHKYDFGSLSTIKISADATNKLGIGTEAVTINNVVALVKDRRSIGICPYKEKSTTSYTACADFWNEYLQILVNYILDANFSMVAFIID